MTLKRSKSCHREFAVHRLIIGIMPGLNLVACAVWVALSAGELAGNETAPNGSARRDGLRLLARLDKATYRQGEDITLRLALTNETDHDIYVADGFTGPDYQEVGPGRHFEIHVIDESKSQLRFWSAFLSEGISAGARKVFKLGTGESYRGTIHIVADRRNEAAIDGRRLPARGGTFANTVTNRRHELGRDGHKYSLLLTYQVNPEWFVHQPPQELKKELLWTGKLETAPLRFTVE